MLVIPCFVPVLKALELLEGTRDEKIRIPFPEVFCEIVKTMPLLLFFLLLLSPNRMQEV